MKKIISLFIIFSFVFNNLSAYTYNITPNITSNQFQTNTLEQYCTIVDNFQGTTETKIYCIEDLHCSSEVQNNIYKIIKALKSKYKDDLNMIAVEGGFGEIGKGIIGVIPDEKIKKRVIDKLVDQGRLSGAEKYYALTKQDIKLVGVEDYREYKESFDLLYKSIKQKEEIREIFQKEKNRIEELKQILYIKKLKEVEELKGKYENSKIDLEKYVRDLIKIADYNVNVETGQWPVSCDGRSTGQWPVSRDSRSNKNNIGFKRVEKYIRLSDKRNKIEINKVEYERKRLEKEINKYLTKEEKENLKNLQGQEYYKYLNKLLNKRIKYEQKYKELAKYIKYIEEKDKLQIEELLIEVKKLEEKTKEDISYGTGDAEELVKYEELLEKYRSYLLNESSEKAVEEWQAGKEELKELIETQTQKSHIKINQTKLENLEKGMNRFYELATKRNEIMINNLLNCLVETGRQPVSEGRDKGGRGTLNPTPQTTAIYWIPSQVSPRLRSGAGNDEDADNCDIMRRAIDPSLQTRIEEMPKQNKILITGGYHTNGITKILRNKAVSYTVLRPKITNPTTKNIYINRLTEQSKHLTQAMSGRDGSIARLKNTPKLLYATKQLTSPQTQNNPKNANIPKSQPTHLSLIISLDKGYVTESIFNNIHTCIKKIYKEENLKSEELSQKIDEFYHILFKILKSQNQDITYEIKTTEVSGIILKDITINHKINNDNTNRYFYTLAIEEDITLGNQIEVFSKNFLNMINHLIGVGDFIEDLSKQNKELIKTIFDRMLMLDIVNYLKKVNFKEAYYYYLEIMDIVKNLKHTEKLFGEFYKVSLSIYKSDISYIINQFLMNINEDQLQKNSFLSNHRNELKSFKAEFKKMKYLLFIVFSLFWEFLDKEVVKDTEKSYRYIDNVEVFPQRKGEVKVLGFQAFSSFSIEPALATFDEKPVEIVVDTKTKMVSLEPEGRLVLQEEGERVLLPTRVALICLREEDGKKFYKAYPLDNQYSTKELQSIKLLNLGFNNGNFKLKEPVTIIPDVHGKEEMFDDALKENLTGRKILYDTKELKPIYLKEGETLDSSDDINRYVAVSEVNSPRGPPRVYCLGDILDPQYDSKDAKGESRRAFYQAVYLVQKGVMKLILGNHDLRVFYTSNRPNDPWHLEGDDDVRREIFEVLKKLAKQRIVLACDVIEAELGRNVLLSHAPVGVELYKRLHFELEYPQKTKNPNLIQDLGINKKELTKILKALKYFIEKAEKLDRDVDEYTIDKRFYAGDITNVTDIAMLYIKEEKVYNTYQKIIADYINNILHVYLPEAEFSVWDKGKNKDDGKWKILFNKSVLFQDVKRGTEREPEISLFYSRANKLKKYKEEQVEEIEGEEESDDDDDYENDKKNIHKEKNYRGITVEYHGNSVRPIPQSSVIGHLCIKGHARAIKYYSSKKEPYTTLEMIGADGARDILIIEEDGTVKRVSSEPIFSLGKILDSLLNDEDVISFDPTTGECVVRIGMTYISFPQLIEEVKRRFSELREYDRNFEIPGRFMEKHFLNYEQGVYRLITEDNLQEKYESNRDKIDTVSLRTYKSYLYYPMNALFRYDLDKKDKVLLYLADMVVAFEKSVHESIEELKRKNKSELNPKERFMLSMDIRKLKNLTVEEKIEEIKKIKEEYPEKFEILKQLLREQLIHNLFAYHAVHRQKRYEGKIVHRITDLDEETLEKYETAFRQGNRIQEKDVFFYSCSREEEKEEAEDFSRQYKKYRLIIECSKKTGAIHLGKDQPYSGLDYVAMTEGEVIFLSGTKFIVTNIVQTTEADNDIYEDKNSGEKKCRTRIYLQEVVNESLFETQENERFISEKMIKFFSQTFKKVGIYIEQKNLTTKLNPKMKKTLEYLQDPNIIRKMRLDILVRALLDMADAIEGNNLYDHVMISAIINIYKEFLKENTEKPCVMTRDDEKRLIKLLKKQENLFETHFPTVFRIYLENKAPYERIVSLLKENEMSVQLKFNLISEVLGCRYQNIDSIVKILKEILSYIEKKYYVNMKNVDKYYVALGVIRDSSDRNDFYKLCREYIFNNTVDENILKKRIYTDKVYVNFPVLFQAMRLFISYGYEFEMVQILEKILAKKEQISMLSYNSLKGCTESFILKNLTYECKIRAIKSYITFSSKKQDISEEPKLKEFLPLIRSLDIKSINKNINEIAKFGLVAQHVILLYLTCEKDLQNIEIIKNIFKEVEGIDIRQFYNYYAQHHDHNYFKFYKKYKDLLRLKLSHFYEHTENDFLNLLKLNGSSSQTFGFVARFLYESSKNHLKSISRLCNMTRYSDIEVVLKEEKESGLKQMIELSEIAGIYDMLRGKIVNIEFWKKIVEIVQSDQISYANRLQIFKDLVKSFDYKNIIGMLNNKDYFNVIKTLVGGVPANAIMVDPICKDSRIKSYLKLSLYKTKQYKELFELASFNPFESITMSDLTSETGNFLYSLCFYYSLENKCLNYEFLKSKIYSHEGNKNYEYLFRALTIYKSKGYPKDSISLLEKIISDSRMPSHHYNNLIKHLLFHEKEQQNILGLSGDYEYRVKVKECILKVYDNIKRFLKNDVRKYYELIDEKTTQEVVDLFSKQDTKGMDMNNLYIKYIYDVILGDAKEEDLYEFVYAQYREYSQKIDLLRGLFESMDRIKDPKYEAKISSVKNTLLKGIKIRKIFRNNVSSSWYESIVVYVLLVHSLCKEYPQNYDLIRKILSRGKLGIPIFFSVLSKKESLYRRLSSPENFNSFYEQIKDNLKQQLNYIKHENQEEAHEGLFLLINLLYENNQKEEIEELCDIVGHKIMEHILESNNAEKGIREIFKKSAVVQIEEILTSKKLDIIKLERILTSNNIGWGERLAILNKLIKRLKQGKISNSILNDISLLNVLENLSQGITRQKIENHHLYKENIFADIKKIDIEKAICFIKLLFDLLENKLKSNLVKGGPLEVDDLLDYILEKFPGPNNKEDEKIIYEELYNGIERVCKHIDDKKIIEQLMNGLNNFFKEYDMDLLYEVRCKIIDRLCELGSMNKKTLNVYLRFWPLLNPFHNIYKTKNDVTFRLFKKKYYELGFTPDESMQLGFEILDKISFMKMLFDKELVNFIYELISQQEETSDIIDNVIEAYDDYSKYDDEEEYDDDEKQEALEVAISWVHYICILTGNVHKLKRESRDSLEIYSGLYRQHWIIPVKEYRPEVKRRLRVFYGLNKPKIFEKLFNEQGALREEYLTSSEKIEELYQLLKFLKITGSDEEVDEIYYKLPKIIQEEIYHKVYKYSKRRGYAILFKKIVLESYLRRVHLGCKKFFKHIVPFYKEVCDNFLFVRNEARIALTRRIMYDRDSIRDAINNIPFVKMFLFGHDQKSKVRDLNEFIDKYADAGKREKYRTEALKKNPGRTIKREELQVLSNGEIVYVIVFNDNKGNFARIALQDAQISEITPEFLGIDKEKDRDIVFPLIKPFAISPLHLITFIDNLPQIALTVSNKTGVYNNDNLLTTARSITQAV